MDLKLCKLICGIDVPCGLTLEIKHKSKVTLKSQAQDFQIDLHLRDCSTVVSVNIWFQSWPNIFEFKSPVYWWLSSQKNHYHYENLKKSKSSFFNKNQSTINSLIGLLDGGAVLEYLSAT